MKHGDLQAYQDFGWGWRAQKHLEGVFLFFQPRIDPKIEYRSSAMPQKNLKKAPDLDIDLVKRFQ